MSGAVTTVLCGRKTRSGGTCRNIAGFKTDHVGQGACRYHGGSTPIKHGRYSRVTRTRIRELIETHEADPDPLNILPELAAARALFQDFIERYDEWMEAFLAWHSSWGDPEKETHPKPRQVLDIADAYRIVSEVTKIVTRIEEIRAQNAISRRDFYRVLTEMGRIVDLAVDDPGVREKIHDAWMELRLA